MGVKTLPALASVASAVLKRTDGTTVVASTLWATQPVLVLVLRRPGCVLCRDEAQKLWANKPQLDQLGVGLVCVVHQFLQAEVEAFSSGFFPGPIYHDADKAFYKALNGGVTHQHKLWSLLNPFSPEWKRITAASKNVKQHNVVGDGLTAGGLMLVRAGEGGVAWAHLESQLGLVPSAEEVLQEVVNLTKMVEAGKQQQQ